MQTQISQLIFKPEEEVSVVVLVSQLVSEDEPPEDVALVHLKGHDVQVLHQLLDAVALLGDVGRISPTRQPCHSGQVAGVPAHGLHNEHSPLGSLG